MPDTGDSGGDRLLTVEEVATRLDVQPETVRRLLRRKQLAGMQISRRAGWRIRERDLRAYIASLMNRPSEQPPATE
jgi:excisionase family DNA binding protein